MTQPGATLYPKLQKKPPFSIEVSGYEKKEGETIPRRNPKAKDGLINRPAEDIHTVYDFVKRSADKYGNAKCIGQRKVVRTHVENKKVKKTVDGREEMVDKKWTYFELSEYSYMSFTEYHTLTLQLGAGLKKLGMQQYERVHMYGATSAHWLAMSHGAMSQSLPIVTAYDTLGEDGLRHSLVQTKSKAIFLDPQLLPTLGNCLKDAKDIKWIIYNTDTDVKQSHIDKLKTDFDYLTILSFEDVRKTGEENPIDTVLPKAEDLCCVMYTSGSTGPPKGVSLKHKAVVAAAGGVNAVVGEYIGPSDSLLTYLPQAHIFEFMFEHLCLYWGGTMGYGNPRTLSDANVRHCKGDIREFQPTILVGVPAVWETVKKGIVAKVNQGSFITKNLFWGAMAAKSFFMATGIPGTAILDAVVFKKVKEATGGKLRICMNGGGPIAKETLHFISMSICPMINGYGLTETSAMGALNDPQAWNPNVLGDLPASIEVKLVDFPDAGYFSTNTPPQGEIWIRGDSVTEGYYENEKETKESITEDGWFKTGDIGEFDKAGHLKIIDRKKNLVKTLNGEYIALEKLESIYRAATVVGNICVYAQEDKAKPIAIIVPVEPALQKLAKDNGISGHGLEELVHEKKLNVIVLNQLQAAGKQGGLAGIEIVDGVVMADEEWTAQNGLTTAAQKLQRRKIVDKYKKDIEAAYSGK